MNDGPRAVYFYVSPGKTKGCPYSESWLLDLKTFCHCVGLWNIYHRPFSVLLLLLLYRASASLSYEASRTEKRSTRNPSSRPLYPFSSTLVDRTISFRSQRQEVNEKMQVAEPWKRIYVNVFEIWRPEEYNIADVLSNKYAISSASFVMVKNVKI